MRLLAPSLLLHGRRSFEWIPNAPSPTQLLRPTPRMTAMVHAIAYGNWEQLIDTNIFGIQSTSLGELCIPFACHVRHPISTAPSNLSFPQFVRLPVELQLYVLRFCDKPTLFRLMQTSHSIRTEATKLFFSDPDAWYCVEGHWLESGAHPSDGRA